MEDDVGWRRTILAGAGLRALVGCEDLPSASDTDTDADHSGACLDACTPPEPTTSSTGLATQVGSEGFWGCPVETIEPLTDPAEVDPELGGSPSEVVGARLGDWILQIEDLAVPGTTVPGSLALAAGDGWRRVGVADTAGCADYVATSIDATLVRDGGAPLALRGVVAVRTDGKGTILVTAPSADAQGPWGAPSTTAAFFRVEGPVEPAWMQASASSSDCPGTEPACPTQQGLSTLTGGR